MWYLFGLVWIVMLVFIISRYNRKQRQNSSERATQMAALLADLKANPKAALEGLEKPAAAAAVPAAPAFSRKARLLPQPAALLYYVFRTGLPDHEIFAGVALGELVDLAPTTPHAQREHLMRKLAQQRLDLVVCNKQLEVVAAVILKTGAASQSEAMVFANRCLQTAGIRAVSIDAAAPPRHHEVHALVYG